MKKLTVKQLTTDRQFDAHRIASLVHEIEKLKTERRDLANTTEARMLNIKTDMVKAAAQMMESLCRMIGGPGF